MDESRRGGDLLLDLAPGVGRRAALEAALREAIRAGRLRAGTVLPSSRALAADLGVSRGTVTAAYEILVAEGWLVTRPGATTVVAASPYSSHSLPPHSLPPQSPQGRDMRHDFHPGLPDVGSFPGRAWTEALRRALTHGPDSSLRYDGLWGHPELRVRLSEYVARARGVVCSADGLMVCSGFTQGFAVVAAALHRRGVRQVAVEDPCVSLHCEILEAAGLDVVSVPVDDEGLVVDLVPDGVGAVVVTPALHFPTGVVLSVERRRALVTRATADDFVVVEDDYVGELRYDGRPLPALHSLAPDRVAYLNSVAKLLAPGVRLGWLVPPPALAGDVDAVKRVVDKGASALDQLALAEVIASGAFSHHLRNRRDAYRRRRDQLVTALRERVPEVDVRSPDAGMFVLVELPPGSSSAAEVIADAAERDIRLVSTASCWHDTPAPPRTLTVGFTAAPDHGFRTAVDALTQLLADHLPPPRARGEVEPAGTRTPSGR